MPTPFIPKRPNQGQRLPLLHPKTTLGRHKECDIVLIPADDRNRQSAIRRWHAVITLEQGEYYIEDGDGNGRPSHNGTWVNRDRVPFPDRVRLKNNDIIKICDFSFVFNEDLVPAAEGVELSSIDLAISHDDSSVYFSQAKEKLQLLLEITNRLSNTLDLDSLLPHVLEILLQLFKQADRGFLILVDEATGKPVV